MRSYIGLALLVIVGFTRLVTPGTGHAEECVTFKAIPATASISVESSVVTSSRSPMTFCNVIPGQEYYLNLFSPGYENRKMRFSLSANGGELMFSNDRKPFVVRSLIVPGWGLYAAGHRTRGVWTFALSLVFGYDFVTTYLDYDDARDRASQLKTQARLAPTVPEAEYLLSQAVVTSKQADALEEHVIGTALLAGWIYAGNVVETHLLTSPPKVRSLQGSTVELETPWKSNSRALWRSVFFPGLGQNYLGSYFKGTIFQLGFITSAFLALEAKLNYDEATNAYELALLDLDRAQTVPEIEAALDNVSRTSDKRRDEESKRDVMYIVTGTVWLLNVIDAGFSRKGAEPRRAVLETSYRNSTLWTGMNLSF
jgi:hypothetical protein